MSKKQTEHAGSAKHTPGPWSIHNRAKTAVVDSSGIVVAACGSHSNNLRDAGELEAEQQANARLIAAAPDSYAANKEALAALYGCREVLGEVANVQHAIDLLTATIAKANGGEV